MGPEFKDGKLQTWSQIASYLQVSVRTAQLWANHRRLPVHHLAGERTPVFAFQEELDAWLEDAREDLSAAESTGPVADVRASSSGGNEETAGVVEPAQTGQARWILSRGRIIFGVLVLGAASLTIGLWRWNSRDIAMVNVDGPALIARDASGRELWRHLFQNGIRTEAYPIPVTDRKHWVEDLNGDGHTAVLFEHYADAADSVSTPLYCFGRDGKIRWRYVNTRVVRDRGGEMAPVYLFSALQVLPGLSGLGKLIAVSSVHMSDQACQVALLDPAGRLVAEYWHPGHIAFLRRIGGNAPGDARLLAAGVSDGDHRAVVVVLNPYKMRGASTPSRMADQRFRMLDMPEAHEELVILFPRSCLDRDEPKTMVSHVTVNEHNILVDVVMGHNVAMRWKVFFEFTPDFRLKRVFPSTEYWQEHLRLEREGRLDHSWQKDMEMLAKGVEYRKGN
jgi:hypothetical protein